ncbi:MAG TPA: DUF5678 domain-containing protein [Thermomicrobiales bacterium]
MATQAPQRNFDEMNLPPMPPKILAAYKRMWSEPDLFDDFDPGDTGIWVIFSGERVVAHGPSLEEASRIAREAGEKDEDLLIVPLPPDDWVGIERWKSDRIAGRVRTPLAEINSSPPSE